MSQSKLHRPQGVFVMSVDGLTSDLLVDIFLKLPVKSLARAKWTCKRLHTIISDPGFVEKHWKDSVNNYSGYLYTFAQDPHIYFMESNRSVSSVGGDVKGELDHYAESIRMPYGAIGQILGEKGATAWSSGGLLAFTITREKCFFICNPIIGEKIRVPMGPFFHDDDDHESGVMWWGLGYAPTSKLYKIIVFHNKFAKDVLDGYIYTLGSGSTWRALGDPFPVAGLPYICVECDGSLFFLLHRRTDFRWEFVSFDVELEKCRFWKGPYAGTTNTTYHNSLLAYGDTVACIKRRQGSNFSLCVLRDKVNELWVNELNINKESIGIYPSSIRFRKWIDGGTIFGRDSDNYIIYDAKRKQLNIISLPYSKNSDGSKRTPCRIYSHIASLVSPKRIMGISVPNK